MFVIIFLKHPGFDQPAAVGKGDAIKIIFDDGLGFRRSLFAGAHSRRRNLRRGRRGALCRGLHCSLVLGGRSRGLRQIFFQQGLKQNDHQECEREDQQQPALHAGILLRIGEFWQIRYSVTTQPADGSPGGVNGLGFSTTEFSTPDFASADFSTGS